MELKIYGLRKRLELIRARLLPTYLKHRYWEYLSRKVATNYSVDVRLPRNVFFETRTRCNSRCQFCPASLGNDPRPDTYMPEELFRKCVDELAELGFDGFVGLWNNNEPLMDKGIAQFVEYVSKKLPRATTMVLTNGLLLTPERGKALLEAGLKKLVIDNYSDAARIPDRVRMFLKEVVPLYPDREVTLVERFSNEKLKNLAGWSPNNRKPLYLRAFCPYPFTDLIITTSGKVGLCCNDFLFQEAVGNVNQDSLLSIWLGKRFRFARENLIRGNRSFSPLCNRCDTSGVLSGNADSLDPINRIVFRYLVGMY